MNYTITGQRREDRARRTIAIGTLAAVTPVVVPAAAIWASWDSVSVAVITMLSTIAAASIVGLLLLRMTRRLAHQQEQFDEERRRWRDEANTDPLCGIANRRGAYDDIEYLLDHIGDVGGPDEWTVLALDIDHFKQVNDTHGHAVGDRVLATVATVLSEHIPPGATVARWGGDEFVVFTLGTTGLPDGWADDLTAAVMDRPIPCREGDLHIGISFGLAQGPTTTPFDDLLAQADDALLAAKVRVRHPIRLDEREVVTVSTRARGQAITSPIAMSPIAG